MSNCTICLSEGSSLTIGDDCVLSGVSICVMGGHTDIKIGDGCRLSDCSIEPVRGKVTIGHGNIIQRPVDSFPVRFRVYDSTLTIGDYNSIGCGLWIRFGGVLHIGSRNAINQRTEIRCDERVTIGDYNQISYDCVIWDTNTHVIREAMERRRIVENEYPCFGLETQRPDTRPVHIGNDCWIGRNCSIMKGVVIGSRCIVGYGTTLVKGEYEDGSTIVNDYKVKVYKNNV